MTNVRKAGIGTRTGARMGTKKGAGMGTAGAGMGAKKGVRMGVKKGRSSLGRYQMMRAVRLTVLLDRIMKGDKRRWFWSLYFPEIIR